MEARSQGSQEGPHKDPLPLLLHENWRASRTLCDTAWSEVVIHRPLKTQKIPPGATYLKLWKEEDGKGEQGSAALIPKTLSLALGTCSQNVKCCGRTKPKPKATCPCCINEPHPCPLPHCWIFELRMEQVLNGLRGDCCPWDAAFSLQVIDGSYLSWASFSLRASTLPSQWSIHRQQLRKVTDNSTPSSPQSQDQEEHPHLWRSLGDLQACCRESWCPHKENRVHLWWQAPAMHIL